MQKTIGFISALLICLSFIALITWGMAVGATSVEDFLICIFFLITFTGCAIIIAWMLMMSFLTKSANK